MSQDPHLPDWATPGPAPASVVKGADTRRVQERHQIKIGQIPPGSITLTELSTAIIITISGAVIPYGVGSSIGPANDKQMYVKTDDGDGGTGTGLWQYEAGAFVRVGPPTKHASQHNAGGADAMAIDAAAGTGSLRTLGAGAAQAAPGTHASQHLRGGADPMVPTLDTYYAPQIPNLVAVVDPRLVNSTGTFSVVNRLFLMRAVVPKAGTLRDVSAFIGTTSGNLIASVYDDGTASAGNYTKLWDSGSVAASTANTWQIIGSPAISVTAGQNIMLGIQADNLTVSIGRTSVAAANVPSLPTGFWPTSGGATSQTAGFNAAASFAAPASVSQTLTASTDAMMALIARVS